ncbi:MAG: UDP-glucose 4-epimerase GalE [Fusobacteria bacterium]|nr:UDP-glucose 4-epimerase GalE [Fusobacteriota bacterium]
MKILVTGGAGYIGSHTCIELILNGDEVIIVDNLSNSKLESIKRVEKIVGKEIPFFETDILDKEAMRKIFELHKIDAVIHFAGYKAVGESVAKPLMYYHNNIEGSVALCEVMSEFDVKKLVFSSSATVYGMGNISPLIETLPLSATNPYGRSKLMIEEILRDLGVSDSAWNIAILRYFNPIGAHSSGTIGEDPNGIPNNLMPFITQVAVGKRERLSVFGCDYDTHDGTGVRDYIHVVDLAKGHVKAVEYIAKNSGVEAINLGTGVGYSVLDIVKSFEKVNGVKVPYKLCERRPGDVATCFANAEKSLNLLNWKVEKSIDDMCRDSWKFQIQNPTGYNI